MYNMYYVKLFEISCRKNKAERNTCRYIKLDLLKRQYKELRSHCYSFKTQLFKLVSRKLVKRKLVSRLFLNLEKLLLTLGIKTTKKLVAMLVYLSKEYIYNSFV